MKPISCILICFLCLAGRAAIHPVMAQDASTDPLITLKVNNTLLVDVLETITRDTGYRFSLNGQWKDHPVSATITNLPLEKGLKRILRSLNHSIVWESEKIVTITVFGKTDSRSNDNAISFASPPQTVQEEAEPSAETEPAPAGDPNSDGQATQADLAVEEDSPTPEAGGSTAPE